MMMMMVMMVIRMMIMMIMMMLTNPCNSDRDSQEGELGSSALESRGKDPTCGETSNLYGIVCFIRSTRGWVTIPKRMNLQKSFKRPLTPPTPTLIFGFDHVAFFFTISCSKALFTKCATQIFGLKMTPPLQLFRKFICFRVSSPVPKYNNIFQMIWLG